MTNRVFIGIDAGGSRLRLVGRSGSTQVEFESAGVNLWRDGVETTGRRVASAVERALSELGSSRDASLVAGVAGALDLSRAGQLEQAILDGFRGVVQRIRVISDIQLAHYAAHGDAAGLTVVIGTGSVVFARSTSGEERVVGGWGYLMGDEGSGFAIGRALLQHLAHCHDKGVSSSLATILERESATSMRTALLKSAYAEGARIQDHAPAVIRMAESGDTEAINIVEQQTGVLADQIGIAQEGLDGVPLRVSLVGGLSANTYYTNMLCDKLQERSAGFERIQPGRKPLDQALLMAQQNADTQT
ncbi:MAG: hypothetical protein KJO98_09375 [Rhodothermia bacterium]|nr:hypothetical protein [Rhodothermia bacterium]